MLVKICDLEGTQFRTALTGRLGLVMPQDDPDSALPTPGAVRVGLSPAEGAAGPVGNEGPIEEKWLHPHVLVEPGWPPVD